MIIQADTKSSGWPALRNCAKCHRGPGLFSSKLRWRKNSLGALFPLVLRQGERSLRFYVARLSSRASGMCLRDVRNFFLPGHVHKNRRISCRCPPGLPLGPGANVNLHSQLISPRDYFDGRARVNDTRMLPCFACTCFTAPTRQSSPRRVRSRGRSRETANK